MSVLFPLYYPATNEQQVLLQHIALHVLKVINDLISAEYTYLHDCASCIIPPWLLSLMRYGSTTPPFTAPLQQEDRPLSHQHYIYSLLPLQTLS